MEKAEDKEESLKPLFDDVVFSKERINKVFSIYSEKSSVSGIAFIIGSKYPAVRIIWTFVLIVALIALTCHLTLLFIEYYAYEKHTVTSLNFSVLPFPVITFCNVNPIRMSKLHLAEMRLQNIVHGFNPKRILERQEANFKKKDTEVPGGWQPRPDDRPQPREAPASAPSSTFEENDDETNSKHEFHDYLDDIGLEVLFGDHDISNTADIALTNTTDEQHSPIKPIKQLKPYFVDTNSTASIFVTLFNTFQSYFAEQTLSVKEAIGHSLGDILIHCSFGGKRCQPRDFTSFSSNHYGNCYTIDVGKHNLVTRDGPLAGLDMILYLQVEDHIKGFTNSKGAQVVIHEPGTVPSPHDDGFSVSAGTHTMVGLRMHDINRLGHPYGDCVPEGQSSHMPSTAKYTREACQKYCQVSKIYEECGCVDATFSNIIQRLHNVSEYKKLCRPTDKRDIECVRETLEKIAENYQTACNCPNPCREKQYMKSISSRQWPDEDYAAIFVNSVCEKRQIQECDALRAKHKVNLREEFVKLSIFYEDLNYQELREVANYKYVNLISDIGGTIGLWIGLSLVSMFEMIHLLMSFIFTTCLNKWKTGFTQRGSTHTNDNV